MTQTFFDIETVGVAAEDTVTVSGMFRDDTFTVFAYVPDGVEIHREFKDNPHWYLPDEWLVSGIDINVITCHSEEKLINLTLSFFTDMEHSEEIVGFYSSEYDLPTLRTKCIEYDVSWDLPRLHSVDLYYRFRDQFNTAKPDIDGINKNPLKRFAEKLEIEIESGAYKADIVDAIEAEGYEDKQLEEFLDEEGIDRPTKSSQDLDGIFELLCEEPEEEVDPFDSSEEAVTAFEEGNIKDIVLHNVMDLYMTQQLYQHVQEYIHEDEIRSRKL